MISKKLLSLVIVSSMMVSGFIIPVQAKEKTPNSVQSISSIKSSGLKEHTKEYIKNITKDDNTLKSYLSENGVNTATIKKLMQKLHKGDTWDSLKSKYSKVQPTSIEKLEDGTIKSKTVYPDGSIRVNIESPGTLTYVPAGEITPISDGTMTTQVISGGT